MKNFRNSFVFCFVLGHPFKRGGKKAEQKGEQDMKKTSVEVLKALQVKEETFDTTNEELKEVYRAGCEEVPTHRWSVKEFDATWWSPETYPETDDTLPGVLQIALDEEVFFTQVQSLDEARVAVVAIYLRRLGGEDNSKKTDSILKGFMGLEPC